MLGLVGKAITFDAGGISLKPALKMQDMKGDMAGGAAVIAGIAAVAELELPVRDHRGRRRRGESRQRRLVPAGRHPCAPRTARRSRSRTPTQKDGSSSRTRCGTPAAHGATHLLDLATLTGAMELALGDFYAGAFANEDDWMTEILAAAEASGDHTWPFPLHPRYRRYVDSSFADLKNSSDLRQGSPVLAAEFLREFAGEGPWAHIDMAGPGFLERSRGDYLTQRGGTGYGVRLIVELAKRLSR